MTISDQSWMDDVIAGKDHTELDGASEAGAGFTESGVEYEEGDPIKSVVNGFMNKAHLFSKDDLRNYINSALQNEGGTMLSNQTYVTEVTEGWEGYAENLRSGLILEVTARMTVEEAEAKGAAMLADFQVDYAEGRRLLAETVVDLHDANEIELTSETWGTLADLDQDGYFSECLSFDVQSALVAAIKAEHKVADPTAAAASTSAAPAQAKGSGTPTTQSVDFSREVSPELAMARQTLLVDSPVVFRSRLHGMFEVVCTATTVP